MLAGFLTLGSMPVQAAPEPDEAVKALVINAIEYPEEAINQGIEGDVVVSFKRNSDGKLEVTGVNSAEPLLAEYVCKTICALDLPLDPNANTETIYLRFSFVLL